MTTTLLSGCVSFENKETNHPTNACLMLKENDDWKDSIISSHKRWGIPPSIILAFIYQESTFTYDARPINHKRKWLWQSKYASTSLGFSQALDGTWKDYKKSVGNPDASRKSFSDSVDFIGWYTSTAIRSKGIKKTDAYTLYLAYHLGINGYKTSSKDYHKSLARKVSSYAKTYSKQINKCKLKI